MTKWRRVRKDHVAAVLLMAMGIAILVIGFRYRMGTLVHMGAGFIPVVLGILMTVVGLVVGVLANFGTPEEKAAQALPDPPDLRGGLCILAAVGVFVLLGAYGGLVPAAFGSVFVAAMGDRNNTWKTALLLSLAMTVFGVAVFHYGLRVQLPLFTWGN
ncbi:MAG: tripartite tricarboxylate transporter TctB family protein [Caldimonas sp.]|nr:tripartite tricarboxylate transporter TctB family protein [Pseudomonadota bacterium]